MRSQHPTSGPGAGGTRHRLRFVAAMRLRDVLLGRPSDARLSVDSGAVLGMSPGEAAAATAVALARDQLSAELGRSDSDDVKALGFLAFDLAGAALAIQARTSLNRFWWAAVAGLAASALLLVVALWRRRVYPGPAPRDFYKAASGVADREEVALLAIDLVTRARDQNRQVRMGKARWYTASVITLLVTVVGSGIYLWQVH
jgi:hypothetical protein